MDSDSTEFEQVDCSPKEAKLRKKKPTLAMSEEHALYFISLLKSHRCLWDKQHYDYKISDIKTDAWESVSEAMGLPTEDLKEKWISMRGSFRNYQSKVLKSRRKARRVREILRPTWFAYEPLKFLWNGDEPAELTDFSAYEKEEILPKTDAEYLGPPLSASNPEPAPPIVTYVHSPKTDAEYHSPTLSASKPDPTSRIVTYLNVEDNTVVCKRTNRPPPSTKSMENTVRIHEKTYAQLKHKIMPMKKANHLLQRSRPSASRSTEKLASVEPFVNFIQQELSQLSAESATMAQMEIHRIIGDYRLQDLRKRGSKSVARQRVVIEDEQEDSDGSPELILECKEEDLL